MEMVIANSDSLSVRVSSLRDRAVLVEFVSKSGPYKFTVILVTIPMASRVRTTNTAASEKCVPPFEFCSCLSLGLHFVKFSAYKETFIFARSVSIVVSLHEMS